MIAHRTFTEQTAGLTGRAALDKREKLREMAEAFAADALSDSSVVNITETAMATGGLFSVTVWFKKRHQD